MIFSSIRLSISLSDTKVPEFSEYCLPELESTYPIVSKLLVFSLERDFDEEFIYDIKFNLIDFNSIKTFFIIFKCLSRERIGSFF